ncbi:MAG TPA: hypothetical protein DIT64_10310, partial [Verrucomicrobiales bacterium]|nr:hypothetical protein [Verrucomicrobiales bacterium]
MSRRVLPLLLLSLAVQTARPQERQDSAAERGQAAAIQPPALPAAQSAPAAPVAPPLPGQLKAGPAAAPAPLTPLPPMPMPGAPPPAAPAVPETKTPVPSVPLPRVRNPSSTSTTGQFIVHGESLPLRSAFSSKCEDISEELRKLLRDKQPWAIPIVVLLSSGDSSAKAGKAVSTQISQLAHGGFHIQVSIHLRPDLRQADIRRELIRAMLAERILRGRKQITSSRSLLLPDWLFTGVIEALDYRSRARPSALFAAIFKSGKIYSIEEIIEASPADLDGLSKSIYQVSSCALLLSLVEQPDGGARMGAFLGALASDPRPERDLLNQHFPAIAGTPSSLNKWWSLQLASLASPSMAEPLDLEESLVQLESALTFRYQARPSEIPKPRPVIASAPAPEPRPRSAAPSAPPAESPAGVED